MMILKKIASVPLVFLLTLCLAACGGSSGDESGGTPPPSNPGTTSTISQFGITWTFDQAVQFGRFANGDYWVLGPVTLTRIEPASTASGGRIINGAMINPSPQAGGAQGYDSAMYGGFGANYDADRNVARPNQQDLSVANPLVVEPSTSLVSTISEADAGARPQLQSAAILTVLDVAPPDGSLRPAYCGDDKTVRYNKQDLNYRQLASLAPVANTPALSQVERYFERPWLDHVPGWTSRFQHPRENMPDYGREIADRVGIGALMLHLDFSDQAKETLLVRYVQLGIDLFGIVMDGGQDNWPPNGGHASGRKWPIVMAGILLDDAEMKAIGPGDGSGLVYFGEDAQTFYVTQEDIDRIHDPDPRAPHLEYESTDLGLPEWGIRHATEPVRDNKHWEATYRQCCTAVAWSGFVLAARIMGAQTLWGHDALFDYQDRYMQITAPGAANPGYRSWNLFAEEMWDTYRPDY